MFTGYQSTEELAKNLIDAGCSEELIDCLVSCLLVGNKEESLCQLEEHRTKLLHNIHKEQSDIEYLNALLVSLREENR